MNFANYPSSINHHSRHHRAFTLVELLVVIAIIGVLASIGLANFRTSQIKSRDAQRKSDAKQIQNTVELIYNDHGAYPLANAAGQILACNYNVADPASSGACTWGDTDTSISDTNTLYLKRIPADPGAFDYYYASTGTKYKILSRLENPDDLSIVSGLTPSCGSLTCNFGLSSANTTISDSTF